MKKFCLISTIIIVSCSLTKNSSGDETYYYPAEVTGYFQAPGYYSNSEYFSIKNNMDKILDFPIGGGTIAPNNDSIITLGEAGGYVVVKFEQPILNSEIGNAYDFIIYGNVFWLGNDPLKPNMEPGFVEVKMEQDDTWYLLVPEANRVTTNKVNLTYNKSEYPENQWPEGADDSFILSSWVSTNYIDKEGFCEISPTLIKPDNQDNITFYANSDIRGGGDPFKIEWAVNSNFESVELEEISYIKITTGVYTDGDFASETEIDSIIRINYENY